MEMERIEIKENAVDFPSLEFSKLCVMIEAKIIALSNTVVRTYKGNI